MKNLLNQLPMEESPRNFWGDLSIYYVIALLLYVLFWHDSPIGIVSLATMSGGDGFADIVGRKFGAAKLPYNDHKSWAGSIAMFLLGGNIPTAQIFINGGKGKAKKQVSSL